MITEIRPELPTSSSFMAIQPNLELNGYHHLKPRELRAFVEGKPLPEKIETVHSWFEDHVKKSGISEFVRTGDPAMLAPNILEDSEHFHALNNKLRADINTPEAVEALRIRAEKHDLADSQTEGLSTHERMAARIAQFKKVIVVSDLDNTLTDHSKLDKKGSIDPTLPGSAIADPLMGPNREGFVEIYAAVWKPLMEQFPEVFTEGGSHAPLRDGIGELTEFLKERHIQLNILSTNFSRYVEGVLARIPNSEQFGVCTVTLDDMRAAQKGDVIKWIAINNPDAAVIYIGDGGSDMPSLEAQDAVACYGALADGSFEKELEGSNVLHFRYRDCHDMKAALEKVV